MLRLVMGAGLLMCWSAGQAWRTGMSSLHTEIGLARFLPVDWLLTVPGWVLFSLVYGVAAIGFLFRVREAESGWTLMFCMAGLVSLEMSLRSSSMPHLHVVLFGVLLGTWLMAGAWAKARGFGSRQRQELVHEAMAGAFGAMLMLAAGSKLHQSGLDWFDGGAHCAVMFEHALLAPDNVFTPVREASAKLPMVCSLGAVSAVGIEALGILMIWPSLRKLYAVLVVGLFGSLVLLYGMFEIGWPVIACALAWSRMEPAHFPMKGK